VAAEIRIPKLAVSMTEGTIVEWLVVDGSVVSAGAALYRLETDKVEVDVEAPCSGMLRVVAPAGNSYPTGTVVAEIT
jgi:pyruvate/2-oxoglutarate dehydrogenase complex dihydrolipoamide acyltransferase (E2) component